MEFTVTYLDGKTAVFDAEKTIREAPCHGPSCHIVSVVPAPRTCQVKVRCTYGQDRVYPASPDAFRLARLAGTKTFEPRHLDVIRELGYEITMASESPRLPDGFGHATVI